MAKNKLRKPKVIVSTVKLVEVKLPKTRTKGGSLMLSRNKETGKLQFYRGGGYLEGSGFLREASTYMKKVFTSFGYKKKPKSPYDSAIKEQTYNYVGSLDNSRRDRHMTKFLARNPNRIYKAGKYASIA